MHWADYFLADLVFFRHGLVGGFVLHTSIIYQNVVTRCGNVTVQQQGVKNLQVAGVTKPSPLLLTTTSYEGNSGTRGQLEEPTSGHNASRLMPFLTSSRGGHAVFKGHDMELK